MGAQITSHFTPPRARQPLFCKMAKLTLRPMDAATLFLMRLRCFRFAIDDFLAEEAASRNYASFTDVSIASMFISIIRCAVLRVSSAAMPRWPPFSASPRRLSASDYEHAHRRLFRALPSARLASIRQPPRPFTGARFRFKRIGAGI